VRTAGRSAVGPFQQAEPGCCGHAGIGAKAPVPGASRGRVVVASKRGSGLTPRKESKGASFAPSRDALSCSASSWGSATAGQHETGLPVSRPGHGRRRGGWLRRHAPDPEQHIKKQALWPGGHLLNGVPQPGCARKLATGPGSVAGHPGSHVSSRWRSSAAGWLRDPLVACSSGPSALQGSARFSPWRTGCWPAWRRFNRTKRLWPLAAPTSVKAFVGVVAVW